MKRFFCILLSLIWILPCFAGCNLTEEDPYIPTGSGLTYEDGPAPTTGEEVQALTLTYYPHKTLNPITCTDYTNRLLFPLLYQSLFVVDRDYNAKPMLCDHYVVSEDMRVYTFFVANALFSNGEPVTAQDVVATLQAAAESVIYKGRFLHVSKIELTARNGVQITLDTSMENFPALLDIPIIPAAEITSDRPAGTGPYTLDTSGIEARLRRRTDWWCNPHMSITAPSITLLEAESIRQIRDSFQFGGVDLVLADPGSDSYADYRCDFELWSVENGIFLYLACSDDSDIFSNDAVRIGLTHAIDRDLLCEDFYRGFARAAALPASPDSPYYNETLAAKYGYDPVKFTQILNDNGFSGAEITLLVNNDDSLRLRVARQIAEMLRECGLKVKMSELGGNNYRYAVITRQYDLYLGQTMLSPNMDLSPFFATYGELSWGGVNDVAAYALCMEALANHGNYYSLHKTVMDNGLMCPVLFRSYAVYATRGLVTGLTPSRDNVFYYDLGKTLKDVRWEAEPAAE